MKMTRRDAVASFALFAELMASGRQADAHAQTTPAAAPQPPVFTHDLPNVSLDGWEVTVSHVDYPPGRVGNVHLHASTIADRVRAVVCNRGHVQWSTGSASLFVLEC